MGIVQADVPDRDIRIDALKFVQGNDSVDAVISSGIEEADMERENNPDVLIM